DGVQVRKTSEREGPVTRTKPCRAQEGDMLYGHFVKLARLEEQERAFLASSAQRKDGPGTAPSGCLDPQRSSQAKKHDRSKTGCYREEPGGRGCLKAKPKRKKTKMTKGKELDGP
ncbi:hypothetical protein E2320_000976, partial [Naja naja]